jgi:membrane protein involved in colicin uptake
MKKSIQAISKALVVVSLLISVLFLEGCYDSLEDIFKLPPEQMQEAIFKFQKEQARREKELKEKEAAFKEEAERQRKEKEEWEKQKKQEEAERLKLEEERKKKEEADRLEREEKERKRKEELEQAQAELEALKKKQQDKQNLDSEVKRVALILPGVANSPDQLEKKIEELTPHGKAINQAFKDGLLAIICA